MPTAGRREKVDRDGQTRDAGNYEGYGRMQGVHKMDTQTKCWEGWGLFNECRKEHGFGWGMT